MNLKNSNIGILSICLIFGLIFSSCNINMKNNETKNTNETTSETNALVYNDKKDATVDNKFDMEKFKNSLHVLLNNATDTQSIVNGKGEILIKSKARDSEYVYLIEDVNDGISDFMYKTIYGENIVVSTYSIPTTGEEYNTKDISSRTLVYDKNGNDVGLSIDNQNIRFSAKNKIFYNIYTDNEGSYDVCYYDVDEKKSTKLPHKSLDNFNDFIVNSSSPWDKIDSPYETLIYDVNMNFVKKINNYTMYSKIKIANQNLIAMKRISTASYIESNDNVDMFNYMDDHFNFIFDEDVNTRLYNKKESVVTIRRGDIQFDYDFVNRKQIGEDKPYIGYEDNYERLRIIKDKYEATASIIHKKDENYDYVDTRYYNGKVLFFAQKVVNDEFLCDIYDVNGNLLLNGPYYTNIFEDQGVFLLGFDTLYDFDMNVIKKFDEKIVLDKYEKFDKAFFTDSSNKNYESRDKYNLYDDKFKLIMENVVNINCYTYDDYLVVADTDKTYILDKNLNKIKTFDRSLDLVHYDDDVDYYNFTDLKTNRQGIIDNNFNIIIDNMKYVGSLQKDYFTYLNGFKYGFMDYNGNVIYSYSIFDTMTEDSIYDDYKIKFIE